MKRALVVLAVCALSSPALAFGPPRPISSDFFLPTGVATDGTRVFVADTGHFQLKHAALATLVDRPSFVAIPAVPGFDPTGERLGRPVGVAADSSGNVFVVDQAAGEVQRFAWDGTAYVHRADFLAAPGVSAEGIDMRMPTDVGVDAAGNVYVLDGSNQRVLIASPPAYASWSVFASDPTWPTCQGIGVASAGDRVFLACPGDTPLIEVPAVGASMPLGRPGSDEGELYEPQDVLVLPTGELVVADTGNSRIELLEPVSGAQTHVALSPIVSQPNRLAESGGSLFVTDVARNELIAFIEGIGSPSDVFVRDYVGDGGAEPSSTSFTLTSPDLIVRQNPDVDLMIAERDGLDVAYASQQPRADHNNYVYLAVRNRGTADALGVLAQFFESAPGAPSFDRFSNFYRSWDTPALNEPNHTLVIDRVPAAIMSGGASLPGYRVVGPLVWRPSAPVDALTWDGRAQLLVRLNATGDATVESPTDPIRASNNISRREVSALLVPPAIGTQNVLVVLARFAGSGDEAPRDRVGERLAELGLWINEVSGGASVIEPLQVGPYQLSQNAAYYAGNGRDPLVEMTQEVVGRAYADNPEVLDGMIPEDSADDISRVVVVVNDSTFPADRATTEAWPYTIGGRTRWLSTSVHTSSSALAEWAHGFSHQLGLKDLHLYPGITLSPSDRLPLGWDVMARPNPPQRSAPIHPLGISKSFAPWIGPMAGVLFLPRPIGNVDTGVVRLAFQSILQAGEIGLIAFGLTPGVTDFYDERHFILLEARSSGLGDSDAMLPGRDGVLVYRYDADVDQGGAPVLISDHAASTPTVADATIPVGATHSFLGANIEVISEHDGDPRAGYDVRVVFTPPPLTDVGIEQGEVEWESPDIWIDSGDDGFVEPPSAANPGTEQARAGADNWVYARVHNYGDATAYDVEVRFSFSDPYHTVGGEGQFVPYSAVLIPSIPAGGYVNARVLWRPATVDDPHRCVRVELARLINDQNDGNNDAQKNLQIAVSTTTPPPGGGGGGGSYGSASMSVQWRNTGSAARRIYYRVDGAPSGWNVRLTAPAAMVGGGVRHVNTVVVQPPAGSPMCTSQRMRLTAWAPQHDTIARLGGSTLDIGLKRTVTWLQPYLKIGACGTNCQLIEVRAQLSIAARQKVLLRFTEESGFVHFKTAYTDATGKLDTPFTAKNGGRWKVRFDSVGDNCSGPATYTLTTTLNIPRVTDQDYDGLPDALEITGDADGDGKPNIFDTDSDNDKRGDGQETRADSDFDGVPNLIDRDS